MMMIQPSAHIGITLLDAGGVRAALRPERPEPLADDAEDVLPEVDEHGELGAQLRDRGEGRPRVAPAGEVAEDAQVCARRDRQELRQALQQAEDDRLDEIHLGILPGMPGPQSHHVTLKPDTEVLSPVARSRNRVVVPYREESAG